MKKLTYVTVLMFLIVGILTGCSTSPSEPSSEDLYGTWQNEVQSDGITKYYDLILGSDGTFIAYETYQNPPADENSSPDSQVLGIGNGTFTYEDDKLNLTYDEVSVEDIEYSGSAREVDGNKLHQTVSYTVTKNGDELTLKDGNKEIKFKKEA